MKAWRTRWLDVGARSFAPDDATGSRGGSLWKNDQENYCAQLSQTTAFVDKHL